MRRDGKRPDQAQWEMIDAKSDQSQKMKPHQKNKRDWKFHS